VDNAVAGVFRGEDIEAELAKLQRVASDHLVPRTLGLTVDAVDVAAGSRRACQFGYDSPEHQMVGEYALMRHARGGRAGACRGYMEWAS
jgi:hypothetical protein